MVEAFGKCYAYEKLHSIFKSGIQSCSKGGPGRTICEPYRCICKSRSWGEHEADDSLPEKSIETSRRRILVPYCDNSRNRGEEVQSQRHDHEVE